MKKILLTFHRYAGLVLTPFFLILLITGMILSFKPILSPSTSSEAIGSQQAQALSAVVQQAEAVSGQIQTIALDANGQDVWIKTKDNALEQRYNIAEGRFIEEAGMSSTVYNTAKSLHKNLLLDAGDFVEFVTYIFIAILLVAPFLMKPRWQKRLMSIHNALGFWAIPLWLLVPITGLLMSMKIGAPEFGKLNLNNQATPAVHVMQVLERENQLQNFVSLETVRGRSVLINLATDTGVKPFQVSNKSQALEQLDVSTYWPKLLHEGTWAGALSGWLNFMIGAGLSFFTISGAYSWIRRWKNERAARAAATPLTGGKDAVLVTYASQTGTAQGLAKATQQYLVEQGVNAQLSPMSVLSPADLSQFAQTLLLCSTTGEGDLPDGAKRLVNALKQTSNSGIHYSVFALGDKSYQHYCAGGQELAAALAASGGKANLETVCSEADPGPAWQAWIKQISSLLGLQATAAPKMVSNDTVLNATLRSRVRLDDPELAPLEVQMLNLELPKDAQFRGGDLLLVTPPGESTARPYSIGSDAIEGNLVRLTVSENRFVDEQGQTRHGVASNYLLKELNVGDSIQVTWRRHPDFNLIEGDKRPIIMAATGCGVAPLLGFLPQLRRHPRFAWLFFGNSHSEGNNFYKEEWDQALAAGTISHISRVFDNENRGYIQDLMQQDGQEIYRLLDQENAMIYLCGRARTVGQGVESALLSIAQKEGGKTREQAAAWLDELRRQERIRSDLFG